jgi:hypothetical protein
MGTNSINRSAGAVGAGRGGKRKQVLVVFSTHEAILTQVLKNACCRAT